MRVAYINNAHDLELWYFQILADLFGKSIYNLDIARNSRCLHVRWIVEDSVLPTLSKKLAPMLLQMAKQYPSLHQTATLIFSQTNSLPVNPFSASSLLETKINSIASRRFSRVSSLSVSSRHFFNVSDIPIIGFLKYCGKCTFHNGFTSFNDYYSALSYSVWIMRSRAKHDLGGEVCKTS